MREGMDYHQAMIVGRRGTVRLELAVVANQVRRNAVRRYAKMEPAERLRGVARKRIDSEGNRRNNQRSRR